MAQWFGVGLAVGLRSILRGRTVFTLRWGCEGVGCGSGPEAILGGVILLDCALDVVMFSYVIVKFSGSLTVVCYSTALTDVYAFFCGGREAIG